MGAIGFLQRTDQQFHWFNQNYGSFDDFLTQLTARKRKAIRKERRQAREAEIEIEWITGSDFSEDHWDAFYEFYMDTGARKWGSPYLNRTFFSLIGERMADEMLLVLAKRSGRIIAGALNFIGSEALYGRYWGCIEDHRFLHFELCYYQAIDYAIEHGLKVVEAGAQGPHKLARGYLPITTYSAHYIADPSLRRAIDQFLDRETQLCRYGDPSLGAPRALPQERSAKRRRDLSKSRNSQAADPRPRPGDLAMAYDDTNIFAKILRGELPCHKVYEDDHNFAFLDIMPRADGHTLVIPKAKAVNLFDISPDDLARLTGCIHRLAPLVRDAMEAEGIMIQQFNEAAAGQMVFHIHFHIVPRWPGEALRPPAQTMEDEDVLAAHAEKIRTKIASA